MYLILYPLIYDHWFELLFSKLQKIPRWKVKDAWSFMYRYYDSFTFLKLNATYIVITDFICGVLRDFLQLMQFKKREKQPWKSDF